MTNAEYESIRKAAYKAAMEIPEVRKVAESALPATASIYIIREGIKRKVLAVHRSTKLNMRFLEKHGFTGRATVKHVLTVSKACEMVFFIGD